MVAGVMVSGNSTLVTLRLQQMRSNTRRNILRTAGRKAAKIIVAKLKTEEKGKATGLLQRSLKSKVKSYAANNTVFVTAGAKSTAETVTEYKDPRTGRMRPWARPRQKGPKIQNPAKYSHLAGPRRKGIFVKKVAQSTFNEVQSVIIKTIEDEVLKR